MKYNDSIDGDFTKFINFVEDMAGTKLKMYQKAYMRLIWKPVKKDYLVISEDVENENTIEFENGSKLTIIPNIGEVVRSKRGEEYFKRISEGEI